MKINLVVFRAVWTEPTEREGKKDERNEERHTKVRMPQC